MNEYGGLLSLNPRAERFASVVAGDLMVNQRAVFQEYPSPDFKGPFQIT